MEPNESQKRNGKGCDYHGNNKKSEDSSPASADACYRTPQKTDHHEKIEESSDLTMIIATAPEATNWDDSVITAADETAKPGFLPYLDESPGNPPGFLPYLEDDDDAPAAGPTSDKDPRPTRLSIQSLEVTQGNTLPVASTTLFVHPSNTTTTARESEDFTPQLDEMQPGAYYETPGESLHRRDTIPFSLVRNRPASGQQGREFNRSIIPLGVGGLAEATPVQDDPVPDIEAQPFDSDEAKRRKAAREKQQRRIFVPQAFFLVCIILAIILGFLFGIKRNESVTSSNSTPTFVPSMAPSEAPSLAPTTSLDILLEELPGYTLEHLNNISTPQWKAFNWLENHPELSGMPESRKKQMFALVTFYHAMAGPSWPEEYQDNWLLYDTSECLWFSTEFGSIGLEDGLYRKGLTYNITPCNEHDEYQMLLLSRMRLTEERPLIPPEITLLTSLSILGLPLNNINASLSEFLPSELYQMTNLQYLNFHTNSLYGSIPSELGMLTKMENVELGDNHYLNGPIPSELGILTGMTKLFLHGNSFSGPIASELGLLTNMSTLSASGNALNGTIPSELGTMAIISQLNLWGNNLGGSIPSEIGSMNTILDLTLSSNSLTGEIPTELGLLTSLTLLHLYRNPLNGTIPSEFGMLTSLPGFLLHSNSLTGSIPSEVGSMTSMTRLRLDDNGLSASIPTEIASLTDLKYIHLQMNMLSGSIPSELGTMSKMKDLYLPENVLTGTIPTQVGMLTRTTKIYFYRNTLTGLIPSHFGMMISLTHLGLGQNFLSGSVPSQLGLMTNLEVISLENNTLTGTIPGELEVLAVNGSLRSLVMANNDLWGTISESFCSLGLFDLSFGVGLSFDCSDQLCGCCWCPCPGSNYSTAEHCQTDPFVPSRDDEEWPGVFPTTPANGGASVLTVNARTDDYPEETTLVWSVQDQKSGGSWEVLESTSPTGANTISSYTAEVESDFIYRLQILDTYGDGNCCLVGLGWFTITTTATTPSNKDDDKHSVVVWDATGNIVGRSLDVFIWIDSEGQAHVVEYLPGQGYALLLQDKNESVTEELRVIVRPEMITNSSSSINVGNGSMVAP